MPRAIILLKSWLQVRLHFISRGMVFGTSKHLLVFLGEVAKTEMLFKGTLCLRMKMEKLVFCVHLTSKSCWMSKGLSPNSYLWLAVTQNSPGRFSTMLEQSMSFVSGKTSLSAMMQLSALQKFSITPYLVKVKRSARPFTLPKGIFQFMKMQILLERRRNLLFFAAQTKKKPILTQQTSWEWIRPTSAWWIHTRKRSISAQFSGNSIQDPWHMSERHLCSASIRPKLRIS